MEFCVLSNDLVYLCNAIKKIQEKRIKKIQRWQRQNWNKNQSLGEPLTVTMNQDMMDQQPYLPANGKLTQSEQTV